jgi:hypothetical protein
MVGRELLIEVSIPAQLRQVHRGVLIESVMAAKHLRLRHRNRRTVKVKNERVRPKILVFYDVLRNVFQIGRIPAISKINEIQGGAQLFRGKL